MSPMTFQQFLAALGPLSKRWPSALDQERQGLVWGKWKHLTLDAFKLGIEKLIYEGGYSPSGKRIDDALSDAWNEYKRKYFAPIPPVDNSHRKALSYEAKKHPDWRDANQNKYSPKLIGIYNTVQRSMLMNDQRGLKGITKVLGISQDDAFKIYELMREENITHPLIFKNNEAHL